VWDYVIPFDRQKAACGVSFSLLIVMVQRMAVETSTCTAQAAM
jgi:hypothetical protein